MSCVPVTRNFFHLRRVLMETVNLPRRAIRPSSRFEELVSFEQRPLVAQRLAEQGLKAPILVLSDSLRSTIIFSVFALATLWGVWLGSWLAYLFGLIEFGLLAGKLTSGWETEFAPPAMTVGDAAILMTEQSEFTSRGSALSRQEISIRIRRVLWDCTGLPPSQIKDKDSFSHLGIE